MIYLNSLANSIDARTKTCGLSYGGVPPKLSQKPAWTLASSYTGWTSTGGGR